VGIFSQIYRKNTNNSLIIKRGTFFSGKHVCDLSGALCYKRLPRLLRTVFSLKTALCTAVRTRLRTFHFITLHRAMAMPLAQNNIVSGGRAYNGLSPVGTFTDSVNSLRIVYILNILLAGRRLGACRYADLLWAKSFCCCSYDCVILGDVAWDGLSNLARLSLRTALLFLAYQTCRATHARYLRVAHGAKLAAANLFKR